MMTKTLIAVLATSSLTFATSASAQVAGFTGEASLSGSRTTGNTETTDLGLALNLQKTSDLWRHTVKATADVGRVSGDTNKKRYTLGYQIDRDLSDRLYVYGNADYFNDDFGSYSNGIFVGTGLGYKLVEPAPLGWDVEGGVGYRSQRPAAAAGLTAAELAILEADGSLDRQNEIALRGASKIKYDLNDNVSLYNNSEVIWGESNTYLWNEVGITATLAGNLAARASYRLDHNTDVLDGTEKTDTITRFGVVYTMK